MTTVLGPSNDGRAVMVEPLSMQGLPETVVTGQYVSYSSRAMIVQGPQGGRNANSVVQAGVIGTPMVLKRELSKSLAQSLGSMVQFGETPVYEPCRSRVGFPQSVNISVTQVVTVGYVKLFGVRGCPSHRVTQSTETPVSMLRNEYESDRTVQFVVGTATASSQAVTAEEYDSRLMLQRLAAA